MSGSACSADSRFHPCLRAVSTVLRRMANSLAPASVRKLPEIFCLTFSGRMSRSARLLVAGTDGSRRKRRVPALKSRSLMARLWPGRLLGRPLRFEDSGGSASRWAMPSPTRRS